MLLMEMPQLLRGILEHAIRVHVGCEVLTAVPLAPRMMTANTPAPDIVIVGLTAAEDATLVPALLGRWPGAQVMTVMATGEDATLYELQPRFKALGHMSPASMVETLVEAVQRQRHASREQGSP